MPIKSELGTVDNSVEGVPKTFQSSKVFVLADLNVNPPETDADTVSAPELTRLVPIAFLP